MGMDWTGYMNWYKLYRADASSTFLLSYFANLNLLHSLQLVWAPFVEFV